MKLLINHPSYNDIECIYFIHTKSNDQWRRDMLWPLTKNYKKIEAMLKNNRTTPIIVGAEKYCYKNKGVNRNYISDIFDRNKDNFNKLDKITITDINKTINKIFDKNNLNIFIHGEIDKK